MKNKVVRESNAGLSGIDERTPAREKKEGEVLEKYTVKRVFRCSREESEEINRRAETERKSQSAYIRDAALNREVPEFDEKVMELLQDIKENELKIGVDINQIVRLCNMKKTITRADYEKLTESLKMIMDLRKEIILDLLNLAKK